MSYTLGITISLLGELLPAIIVWPTQGKRNKPFALDNLFIIYRSEGSWYDIEIMEKTI